MEYRYNINEVRNNLTIMQVMDLVAELGGEPQLGQTEEFFIAKTICHNSNGEGSHKLYYYNNSHMFHCYTECSPETFDIFDLVLKVFSRQNKEWTLSFAVEYVAQFFGLSAVVKNFGKLQPELQDWEILNRYNKISSQSDNKKQRAELKIYDSKILTYLPCPRIEPWEKDGIDYKIMRQRGIRYNPSSLGIVIPHYDMDNNLIGIRERTLVKEEEQYGKYKPAILNGEMYNHPLGFALYNLNNSKKAIAAAKTAIVFEGEKSCMQLASVFGAENDISVATCGSSLTSYQVNLLLSLGVKEIVIAFDRQFKEVGDEEWKKWTDKLKSMHRKYSSKVQISFIFDTKGLLGYKDSPIDKGKETFLKLFKERVTL